MRVAAALCLLLAAASLSAQELTIFDLNDFVDPRSLGASATSRGGFACPCTDLFVVRGISGWSHDFVNVTLPTDLDVGFAHFAASYYRGHWQFNAKFTRLFETNRPADIPRALAADSYPLHALALQIARYSTNSLDDDARIGRVQATWRISHHGIPRRNLEQGTWTSDRLHHEFGLEYDVPSPKRFLFASLTYTFIGGERPRDAWKKKPSRLAYVLRSNEYPMGMVRVQSALSIGVLGSGLQFDDLRRLTLQPNVIFAVPVGRTGINVNVRYAPTFQRLRDGNGHTWDQTDEVAIFIDRQLFHWKRFRDPRKAEAEVSPSSSSAQDRPDHRF